MTSVRPESPADEYFKAVHQLKQFLSESDSSDSQLVRSSSNKKIDRMENADFDNKSNSARKSLFRSPVHQHARVAGNTGGISNDYFLLGLIQKQCLYIKAMEKEISFYRKEVPGLVSETKVLMSNEESTRMMQANSVTQRLFSLIDTVSSSSKMNVNHDMCENQKKKLSMELANAQQQIQFLTQQWGDHNCWNDQNQPKNAEEFSRERSELLSTISKLRSTVSGLQQREVDALRQIQQSVEVAEQAQLERAQMESEVHRLASLVEKHEQQMTLLTAEHARRMQDERTRWEVKLSDQLTTLKRERDLRDEALTRISLDLEQCQRNEAVLKNEIHIKTNLLESSRQDYQRQLGIMQNEQGRLAGQQAELQRRLGEAELKTELTCKSAEQDVDTARTESEFLRRKVDLLSKEVESRKQDYDRTIKELEQRNADLHSTASQHESERVQAVKTNSQTTGLVKYLEQRERTLLHSLQDGRKQHEEKCAQFTSIIEEQRSIICKLKDEYAALLEDFQKCITNR